MAEETGPARFGPGATRRARAARPQAAQGPGSRRAAGRRLALAARGLGGLALAGCGAPASPSVPLFGAYFPSWLICAGIGVLGAVLGRVLFIRLGIDDGLPLRLLVYVCLGLLVAFAAAVTIYGR